MLTYGYSIHWIDTNGSKLSVTVDGFHTPEEAVHATTELAKKFGWIPPKWYELHRRCNHTGTTNGEVQS